MKDDETTDILLVGVVLFGAYYFFFKPKTTTPLLPGQVTSITPINSGAGGGNAAASTAALVSAGGGLFSTIKNLLNPGSTPSQANIINTGTGGEASYLPPDTNPGITFPTTITPVITSPDIFANQAPVVNSDPSAGDYVYNYGSGDDEYTETFY